MPTSENKDNRLPSEASADNRAMNIDVGHLSVTGHVVFAGRDGRVHVNTGGDVEQTTSTSLTVGGVETDRQSYDSLITAIRSAHQIVDNAVTDPNEKEAAQQDLSSVEEQLTSTKQPNPYILVRAAKALYQISPAIAGAIVSIFSEPLAGQIVTGIGGIAIQFYEALMRAKPPKK
jgi:hypothetical protein